MIPASPVGKIRFAHKKVWTNRIRSHFGVTKQRFAMKIWVKSIVASMLISHVSGAEPPKDFLASDDPIWKQVLAEQVSFSKTRITIQEAIEGLIGIPHISSFGGEFKNVVINLPSTKLDQRSLLWILHQQTGAEISVSGMKPDALRGTLSLTPQNKSTMPIRSRDEAKDPSK